MAEGLLDFIKTPEGQGLLSGLFGYAANARQGTPWNNLGRGGVAGLMGYGNALERQDTLAQREQAKKLQDLQAQHYQMQIEAARRADETAKAKQAALPTLWTGGQAARPAYTPFGEDSPFVPMPAKPAVAPTFDWRKALESGYTPDEIAKLAGMQDVGKTEVARTIDVEGPNGEKLVQSVDKFNRPVGNPVPAYMAPEKVDTGGSVQFAKPKAGLTFQKTMTPGEVASNQVALGNLAVAQGNLGVSRDRLAFDKAGGSEASKPQLVDGAWVYKPDAKNPAGRVVPVSGLPEKPLNDSQSKANLFGTRAMEAERTIQSVSKEADRPGWIKRTAESAVGLVPFVGDSLADVAGSTLNWTQSDAQQQVEQAQRDFINATLRRESGASIAPSEFSNARKQYFPQIGDSDAVLAQKARNRQTAIDGILSEVPESRRPSSVMNIPKDAINDLRMNKNKPGVMEQFDQVFGKGSAKRVLGGG